MPDPDLIKLGQGVILRYEAGEEHEGDSVRYGAEFSDHFPDPVDIFGHKIGHNLCYPHDRPNPGTVGLFSCVRWWEIAGGLQESFMGMDCENGGSNCDPGRKFTSPNVNQDGVPAGILFGDPHAAHDALNLPYANPVCAVPPRHVPAIDFDSEIEPPWGHDHFPRAPLQGGLDPLDSGDVVKAHGGGFTAEVLWMDPAVVIDGYDGTLLRGGS